MINFRKAILFKENKRLNCAALIHYLAFYIDERRFPKGPLHWMKK